MDVPPVDQDALLQWAAIQAGIIAKRYAFRGQERDDLISIAQVKLLDMLRKTKEEGGFDPEKVSKETGSLVEAIKRWGYRDLRCKIQRAAQELRSGGMFRSVRPTSLFSVGNLGDATEFDVAAPEEEYVETVEAVRPPAPSLFDNTDGDVLLKPKRMTPAERACVLLDALADEVVKIATFKESGPAFLRIARLRKMPIKDNCDWPVLQTIRETIQEACGCLPE